ncbi:MAG: DUF2157 domain-containing protein [Planctomycetaceae bacterium]|nr:DUF2157 domain-containing protein [Planctomycetaceae bacterium]
MAGQDDKIKWLYTEMEKWAREGVIGVAQMQSIKNLYPQPQIKKSVPWALLVFSGIGAVIIGLGVILLFAYNWDKMGKYAKLSVVFGSLIIAHFTGITIFIRSQRFKGIGESLCVLGTMLFGAGIWLVAQIYHIDEHYPNAFLFWGLGAMLMAWTMPSVIQAILAAVLFTIWAACESGNFSCSVPYVFILLAALLPVAYGKSSRLLITILLLAFSISAIFVVSSYDNYMSGEMVLPVLLGLFSLYIAAGVIHQKVVKYDLLAPYYFFVGLAGYFITLYILGFSDVLREVVNIRNLLNAGVLLYWFVPSGIAFLGWCYVLKRILVKDSFRFFSYDLFFVPLMPFLIFYFCFGTMHAFQWVLAAILNLVFLVHAVTMMGRGCMNAYLMPTIFGSLLLIAIMIARFIDFVDNLALRGVIFLVVGILIFSQGFFYVRAKKEKALQENK